MADAEVQWRQAVQDRKDFTPAWQRLGQLWADQGRWDELAEALTALEEDSATTEQVLVLRGRWLLGRKEFAAAREHLERALAAQPHSLPLLPGGQALWQGDKSVFTNLITSGRAVRWGGHLPATVRGPSGRVARTPAAAFRLVRARKD